MPSINQAVRFTPIAALLLSFAAGCSEDAAGSDAGAKSGAPAQQGAPAGGGAAGSAAGAGGERAGGGGPGGRRPAPSITLAANDVATVAPTTIEDGVALTGDLRPSE